MQGRSGFYCTLLAAFLLIIIINTACERNNYELVDPGTTGQWTLFSTADGLPGNNVSDIYLDTKGRVWFTCPGFGVASYFNGEMTYYRAATSPLANDAVNCVEEAGDGSILFGTFNGLSVYSSNDSWTTVLDPTVKVLFINTIKVSLNKWIWIGTQNQGLYLNNGTGYKKFLSDPYKNIHAVEESYNGTMFFGTDTGVVKFDGNILTNLTKKDGLPSNIISALRYDKKDRMWIGTIGGKSASWLDSKGIHALNLMASTDSINIKDILEDRHGNIWFATARHGVIKYDGVVTTPFREFNGFPDNSVNCIAEDQDGNLWFGLKNKGVVKYTLPMN